MLENDPREIEEFHIVFRVLIAMWSMRLQRERNL